jgi:hypothetical protein
MDNENIGPDQHELQPLFVLPKINMTTKTIVIAAASVIGIFIIGSVALAFHTPDYAKNISQELTNAETATANAKKLSCEYISVLTQDCGFKKTNACAKMHKAEDDYFFNFSADSYEDCFHDASTDPTEDTEQPAPGTSIPLTVAPESDPTNPLFFGDEGQGQ